MNCKCNVFIVYVCEIKKKRFLQVDNMSVTFSGVLRYDDNGKIPGERKGKDTVNNQGSPIFLQWTTSAEMKLAVYGKGFVSVEFKRDFASASEKR